MTDDERFAALLNAEYACIRIITTEEQEARQLVGTEFINRAKPLWIWTASDGVRDGLIEDARAISDTDHPAAACVYLRSQTWTQGAGVVFLDMAAQLTEPRTMRELRDLMEAVAKARGHVIFIDHGDLP